jgi:hypothetical protein
MESKDIYYSELVGLFQLKDCLGLICDGLFHLFYNYRKEKDGFENTVSEADACAQCFLQMAVCKIRTIINMCDGVAVAPEYESIKVLDIPSMSSVVRSLYELAFVFHNIYVEQNSLIERNIVLKIWQIKGLNNRQNFSSVPAEYIDKEAKEKQQIVSIQNAIKELSEELQLPDNVKEKLDNYANSSSVNIKGYKFERDTSGSQIIALKEISFKDRAEELLNMEVNFPLYRFLSAQAHPSYLGLLQFGQMFNENKDTSFLNVLLITTCKLASKMAIDFRDNIDDATEIYSSLGQKENYFIDNFNTIGNR